MKNITKFSVLVCLLLIVNSMYSQENVEKYERNFKFGIGLNSGLPFNDPYEFNLGGDVRLQYNISETYSLSFTTGFNNLYVKDDGKSFNYIPIKVGYKTFLFSNEFYVMGEIGAALSVTDEYDQNSMLFAPSLGYATKYIDISVRYEFLKDFPIVKDNAADHGLGQIMLRLAYGFDL
ncbi:hypothetical protein FLGE108171_05290 [Flavobacterium gelidilacus]|uniref:hypothetical protein n=1 Tax=Flavobacterium gelidilacus TaxID=206041 RepID=UPI00047ED271|nr:hypothetical protein [Flavobacterium gelidilacus]